MQDSSFEIGGFQALSLLDYPEKMACIVFTQGCNLRCPYCHNAALVPPASEAENGAYPVETILHEIKGMKHFIQGVVITGGEPTLQPGLPAFCKAIKAMGLSVKLDTNGTRPQVLKCLLDAHLLDYVAMDVKAPLDEYGLRLGGSVPAYKLEASIELLLEYNIPHEFRTTLVAGDLDEEDLTEMGAMLAGGQRYYLQAFRAEGGCLEAHFADRQPWDAARMARMARRLSGYLPTLVRA